MWIENYRVIEEERKVPRKYYRITEKGKKSLNEQLDIWKDFNDITGRVLELI